MTDTADVEFQKETFNQDKILADNGSSYACESIGRLYSIGKPEIGIPRDQKQAFIYHEKGAKLGSLKCQRSLAHAYIYGIGVEKNPEKGIELLTDAAGRNHAESKITLGEELLKGAHVAHDKTKAFRLFEEYHDMVSKEAASGKLSYQMMVSCDVLYHPLCLFYGIGCKKQPERALIVLKELALLGFFTALDFLQEKKIPSPLMESHLSKALMNLTGLFDTEHDPTLH